jgi:WD40 repeat protein
MTQVYNMPTICLKWHPHANLTTHLLYYAHVNGYVGVCDAHTMRKRLVVEEEDEISCIDFNVTGECLATVGRDAYLRIYDTSLSGGNGRVEHRMVKTYGGASAHERSASTSPRLDGTSGVYQSANSSTATSIYHTNRLQCVKWCGRSRDVLLTGGWDRTVKIWDRRTSSGIVSTLHGPFVCGSDAIDTKVILKNRFFFCWVYGE